MPRGLAAKGWAVEVVDAYATRRVPVTAGDREAVAAATWVTFTSASTVEHFVDAFGVAATPPNVACIGPVTSAAARAHGMEVTVEADPHTVPALAAALADHVRAAARNVGDHPPARS